MAIAAISTAKSPAGIGIVRLSGDDSLAVATKFFESKQSLLDPKNDRKLLYGHFVEKGEVVDEVLAVAFRAPHSYTGEDMVEIQAHGGSIGLERILSALIDGGCEPAERGEFTKIAFLNGKLDLTEAEAIIDMIEAESVSAQRQSARQLTGHLYTKIEDFRNRLKDTLAHLVADIDFSTEEVEPADTTALKETVESVLEEMKALFKTFDRGKLIHDGIATAIIGKPNVGKSSFLNAILREDKAIVTEIPGTTRDVLEASYSLDGIHLRIQDTAGIRQTDDLIEKIGIERAFKSIESADLIIAIFDASKPLEEADYEIIEGIRDKRVICLLNKNDLGSAVKKADLETYFPGAVLETSFIKREGLSAVEDLIERWFLSGDIHSDDVKIYSLRHRNLLGEAIESMEKGLSDLRLGVGLDLAEVYLEDAFLKLGEITGQTADEEVLDHVFSKFCIGK
ncbi:MAG: tRNA uridine-5-carboxymethylaminomethyl(34) synthesis GTPase MnmE [Firmicutes bacterium]|nr:tRNA uridine-5-carboxymethylaminomethyl(34) synthesis GTPase MnmE [Bacillota bacterium]